MKAVPVLLLGACALHGAAQAMSIREMRALEQADPRGETYIQYYLIGVMEGALEADRVARRQGRKPLYCPPNPPAPVMATSLLHAELRRNDGVYEADMPVELVMSNALAAAYRCTD